MKKRNGVFYLLAAFLLSCGHHDHDTHISYKDKDGHYSMRAHFNEKRTRAVEHYMNEKIGKKNNISFMNMESDADLKLDDGTNFHLKKYPGHVEIDMDRAANSAASYYALKEMCEGIKDIVTR